MSTRRKAVAPGRNRSRKPARLSLDALLELGGESAQQVLDLARVILVVIGADERVRMINQTGCRLLGRDQKHIIGTDWFEGFLPERLRDPLRQLFRRTITGELDPPEYFESPVLTASGEERHIEWNSRLLTDPDGTITATLSSGHDVTRRQATEQALRESEQRFRMMAEATPVLFWVVSPDWSRIEYVSPAFERIYGYPAERVYERPDMWINVIHRDDRQRVLAFYEQHHGQPSEQTYRIVRSDGLVRWIRDVCTPVRGSDGELLTLAGFAEDITERRCAEEALRESEANFRALAANAFDGIVIAAGRGRVAYANERAGEILGYPMDELLARRIDQLLHPDDTAKVMQRFTKRLAGGEVQRQYQATVMTRNGKAVPVEITAARTHWHGEPAVLAVVRDISERLRIQRQLEASLREKELLFREVHHRVKNNLQVISSLLAVQADSFEDPVHRSKLLDLDQRVRWMAMVHEQLHNAHDLTAVDVAEYIAAVVARVAEAYAEKRQPIHTQVEVENLTLGSDMVLPCGLILTELVSNAFKHGFPSHWQPRSTERALVRVCLDAGDDDDDPVVLEVADNGIGLAPGIEAATSPSLGLQLVDSLVSQLDGHLELDGDGGTRARISFPRPGSTARLKG